MGMRCRKNGLALYLVAFGAGLLAYLILPTRMMVFILVTALILCGLSCGR